MDRYGKREKIGEGEFGEVYKATDLISGNPRALKKIKGQPEDVLKELSALMKVKHRGIVQLKGLIHDSDEGSSWLEMEYCNSGNLDDFWKEHKPKLPLKFSFMTQLSEALAYLHNDCGIAHRDIKPANIMIAREKDGQYRPKYADFGVSKVQDITEEFMQTRAGTELFIAPEVHEGKYNNKADIFSLGLIFRAMVFDNYVLLDGKYYLGVIFLAEGIFPIALGAAMYNKKGLRFDIEPEKMKHVKARTVLDSMLDPDHNKRPSAQDLHEQLGKMEANDFQAVLSAIPDQVAECKPKERGKVNIGSAGGAGYGDSTLKEQLVTNMRKILKGQQVSKPPVPKKPSNLALAKKPSRQPKQSRTAPPEVLRQRQKSPDVAEKMLTGFPLRAPKQWPPPAPKAMPDDKEAERTPKEKSDAGCAQLGLAVEQLTETKQLIADWENLLISESTDGQEEKKTKSNVSVLMNTLKKIDFGMELDGGEVEHFATALVELDEQVKQHDN